MVDRQVRLSELSPQWQNLIRRMQRLNFGCMRNLIVVDGQPVLAEDFESVATYRFPGVNRARPESCLKDFSLQAEHIEFIDTLKLLRNCKISKIRVGRGLPFQMEVAGPE